MTKKTLYLFGFILCVGAVLVGMLIGETKNLVPCSFCYLERMGMIGLAILFLLAVFLARVSFFNFVLGILILILSTGGAGLSEYHIYLQEHAGEHHEACGASIQYLMENYPIIDAFKRFFASSQDCSIVDWRFLGISMAGYALIVFATAFTLGLLALRSKRS